MRRPSCAITKRTTRSPSFVLTPASAGKLNDGNPGLRALREMGAQQFRVKGFARTG
jgi:hypothetical protein